MRLPRVRLTIGRMMIAVAVLAVALRCAGQSVVGDRRVAAIHLAIRLMIIPGRRASRSGVPTREC